MQKLRSEPAFTAGSGFTFIETFADEEHPLVAVPIMEYDELDKGVAVTLVPVDEFKVEEGDQT